MIERILATVRPPNVPTTYPIKAIRTPTGTSVSLYAAAIIGAAATAPMLARLAVAQVNRSSKELGQQGKQGSMYRKYHKSGHQIIGASVSSLNKLSRLSDILLRKHRHWTGDDPGPAERCKGADDACDRSKNYRDCVC